MSFISSSHRTSRLSSTAAEAKFHGVLAVSKNRVIRRLNFTFFSYLYFSNPLNRVFCFIIEIWRFLQWIIPSLIPGSRLLYPLNTGSRTYSGIMSFFIRIIPFGFLSNENDEIYTIMAPIFICLYFVFFVIYFLSLYFFSLNSLIPKPLSLFLVYFFESVWVLFLPIIMEITGDQIGLIFIQNKYNSTYKGIEEASIWVCFILVVLFYILVAVCHDIYVSVSLSFVPSSMPCCIHNLETILTHLTSLVNFLTGILPYCSKGGRITLYVLTILVYVASFVVIPLFGNFVKSRHTHMFYAFSASAIVNTIFNLSFDLMDKRVDSIVFLVEYVVLLIFIIIFQIVSKKMTLRSFVTLDILSEQPHLFDEEISNVFSALRIAIAGFAVAHPFICNWKYMHMVTDRWPYVSMVWILWARFASCFTDENRLLLWIDDQIQKFIYHTEAIQNFRSQIHSLVERRDASMTSVLKKRVSECHRLTTNCRSKMGIYWESVLAGNAFDMESTAFAAKNANDEADSIIQHYMSVFPNNQYLTQAYLQFLNGIKADPSKIKKWTDNYSRLKEGQLIKSDISQQQGLLCFPNLMSAVMKPNVNSPQQGLMPDIGDVNSGMRKSEPTKNDQMEDNDENDDNPFFSSMRVSISNLSIPEVRNATFALSLFFILFFFIAIPTCLAILIYPFSIDLDFMEIISTASKLRNDITMLSFFCSEKVASMFDLVAPIDDTVIRGETVTYNLTQNIRTAMDNIDGAGSSLRLLTTLQSKGTHVKKANRILFESLMNFTMCDINPDTEELICTEQPMSVESITVSSNFYATTLMNCATKEAVLANVENNPKFVTVFQNSYQSAGYITIACQEIDQQIKDDCESIKKTTKIVVIILSCVIFIVYFVSLIIISKKLIDEKRATVKCFLMIPKHVVSYAVSLFKKMSIDVSMPSETTSTTLRSNMKKSRTDNQFLGLISSGFANQWTVYGNVILIVIYSFIVMICGILATVFIYLSVNDYSHFCNTHSLIHNYFLLPFSESVLAANCAYLLAINDSLFTLPSISRPELISSGLKIAKDLRDAYTIVLFGNLTLGIQNLGSLKPEYINQIYQGYSLDDFPDIMEKYHNIYEVMSASSQFYFVKLVLSRLFVLANDHNISLLNDPNQILWQMLYMRLYLTSSYPIAEELFDDTKDGYKMIQLKIILIFLLFYVIAVIFYGLTLFRLSRINSNIKWIISTMLQFPPEVVMQTPSVVSLLSGSFKEVVFKIPVLSENFYQKVTNDNDDAFLLTSLDTTILYASKACETIFDTSIDNLIGKVFRQLLLGSIDNRSIKKHDSSIDEFLNKLDTAISGRCSLSFTQQIKISMDTKLPSAENSDKNDSMNSTEGNDENSKYLSITLTAFSRNGVVKSLIEAKGKISTLSFSCCDITKRITIEDTLIKEKEAVYRMMTSILPPQIVTALDSPTLNLSFSSQSASVTIIELVDFDSIAASISAARTLSIMSRVFKAFDNIMKNTAGSLTKVQTISDKYLAVGGFFSSINQPEIHTKESVTFGLQCIQAVAEISKEIGVTLQLKIGVNAGGPLIAGILDIGSPTFTVIGTPLDVAFLITAAGEPMTIHISRYVYELIFGASFKIREGAELDTMLGSITTYTVDPV